LFLVEDWVKGQLRRGGVPAKGQQSEVVCCTRTQQDEDISDAEYSTEIQLEMWKSKGSMIKRLFQVMVAGLGGSGLTPMPGCG
jgi:hypothetical protein